MAKNNIGEKVLFGSCLIFSFSIVSGSLACVILFPFLSFSIIKLDIIECFAGCSLALMAFPDAEKLGFITLDNSVSFFLLGLFIVLITFVLLFFQVKHRMWAFRGTIWLLGGDLVFMCFHYFFFPNMLGIGDRSFYVFLSLAYKVFGVLVCYGYTYVKQRAK